jgi:hypothetical protein
MANGHFCLLVITSEFVLFCFVNVFWALYKEINEDYRSFRQSTEATTGTPSTETMVEIVETLATSLSAAS